LGVIVLLGVVLIACSPELAEEMTPAKSPFALTPYRSPTASPSAEAARGSHEEPAETPLSSPTATPFLYTIQEGDTLSAVALKYNVSLDVLLAANPEIDPNFLIVGEQITIPSGEGSLVGYPTATPVPVQLQTTHCYPASDGGMWCLVVVENQQKQALENVSTEVSLYTPEGERIAQGEAIPPLNTIGPESAVPAVVFFPAPLPKQVTPYTQLLTALPLAGDQQRYLEVTTQVEGIIVKPQYAIVQGRVEINGGEETPPAGQIWLAAIAYDEEGKPVGVRKWETTGEVPPGEAVPFEITVYSLGPNIAAVEVLGEARPQEKNP
jgi:LysM repeat protein